MAQYRNVSGLVHMNTNSSVTFCYCSLFYAYAKIILYFENGHVRGLKMVWSER
jgi:hypothetical protein